MPIASNPLRIIIVGGGIAGLSSAIALRGPGREIIILESSQMNKEVGAAISLQPNAVKIVKGWGVEETLVKAGGVPDAGFMVFRTDGVMQMKLPFQESDYGANRLVFHRVDLHDGLKSIALDQSRPGAPAEIRLGVKVASADCEAGVIICESGEEIRGDVIIGADGIHSKIRTSVLGETRKAIPTGLSAYRMIIPKDNLVGIPHISGMMTDPSTWTTMLLGHSCRVVMGPCRNQELLSIVAVVPDEKMQEEAGTSWTSEGSKEDLLKSFVDFPPWMKDTFKAAPSVSLWQLRDMDPLPTWVKGRTILIGDAAHSMLPTQGQGASQSIEDAEAVGAFFQDAVGGLGVEDVKARLENIFQSRYERASTIQGYSRQSAKPATEAGKAEITMNPKEFMDYNCRYPGAVKWMQSQVAKETL